MDTCIWYVMYTVVLDEALCLMMCFLMGVSAAWIVLECVV